MKLVVCIVILLSIGGCITAAYLMAPPRPIYVLSEAPLTDAEMQNCASCHAEATDAFLNSRHYDTLHRGSDVDIQNELVGLTTDGRDGFAPAKYVKRGGRAVLEEQDDDPDAVAASLPADWIFGSGERGYTAVSLKPASVGYDGLIQHDYSLYGDDQLAVTLGHRVDGRKGVGREVHELGVHYSPETAANCFNCHGRGAAVDSTSKLRLDEFAPRIGCDNCHAKSREHAQSEGAKLPEIVLPDNLAQTEIEMCGTCHRTPDDVDPFERDRTRVDHLRYQPVGLSLSACFEQGESGLRCTTCHDAHHADAPAQVRQLSLDSCVNCHDRQPSNECVPLAKAPDDPAAPTCLTCHMPVVEFLDTVTFTDHWIRIRQNDEPAAIANSRSASHQDAITRLLTSQP